ncbi:Abca1, partial [Symbiodinium natans]
MMARMVAAPISAGTRHLVRLWYFPYQTVIGGLKIYAVFTLLQDVNMELFWMSPGLCLVLIPIGFLAGVLSMDSPSDLALAFNIFEDPRVSNGLMKIQAYAVLILHMIPMLLQGSPQAVAQNLAFNALGFFMVLDPLLDGAETLEQVFGTFTILGLARSCMGNVHLTHAICVGVLSNMIEGIVVRVLLRTLDAGLRVPPQGRLGVGDEKFLTGASPYALQQVLDLTRCREGRAALRHALHTLRRRLDRREQAVAQFLFLHYCAVQHKMGSAPLARILDFAAESNEGSAEPRHRANVLTVPSFKGSGEPSSSEPEGHPVTAVKEWVACESLSEKQGSRTLVAPQPFDPMPITNSGAPPTDGHSLGTVICMLILDAVLYQVLAWYIEKVKPGTLGLPQPWYFPVMRSYWFPPTE